MNAILVTSQLRFQDFLFPRGSYRISVDLIALYFKNNKYFTWQIQ